MGSESLTPTLEIWDYFSCLFHLFVDNVLVLKQKFTSGLRLLDHKNKEALAENKKILLNMLFIIACY